MSPQPRDHRQYPPPEQLPRHIGIIMDGNGRWARAKGLPRLAGHRAGTETLRRVLRAADEFGIQVMTIYAFSTENWNRPRGEVKGLLSIMEQVIDSELPELDKEGVQLRHIGRLDRASPRLQQKIRDAIELTKNNQRLILNVAFDYGGRTELVYAMRRIAADGIPVEQIDEALISRYTYTAGLPDPDLIIRTSGEMRVSNFLIWQGAYAEFYVTPTLWPDFDKDELYKALQNFSQRERRFGLVPT
ncbi:MAG: polyprenyl diphosphate synthase [Chloroflexota bacterium]|nr:polyprenyl diphosphate synthase [Chloroflexota bacterium]